MHMEKKMAEKLRLLKMQSIFLKHIWLILNLKQVDKILFNLLNMFLLMCLL